MSALDTSMLAAMRSAILELLPDTCYLITLAYSPDGEGGVTQARGTSAAIACRLDVKQGREQKTGGAIEPYISYKMSLPYDTVVSQSQLISHNGIDYSVIGSNPDQSWSAVVRLDLEKL